MSNQHKSDKELVSSLIQGDEMAFSDLYVRYKDRLVLFCQSMLKSDEEADDIVQEIFINIWESRSFINPELSFSSYLYTIARNRVLNYFRVMDQESKVITQLSVQYESGENHIEADLYEKEYQQILSDAIDLLPTQRKRIFNLSRMDHLSHKEIADQLGISVYTVQEHISAALRFIRQYLTKHADIPISMWLWFLLK